MYQFTTHFLQFFDDDLDWSDLNTAEEEWVSETDRRPWWQVLVMESFLTGTTSALLNLSGATSLDPFGWRLRAYDCLSAAIWSEPFSFLLQQFRRQASPTLPQPAPEAVPDSRVALRRGWHVLSPPEKDVYAMARALIEKHGDLLYPGLRAGVDHCREMCYGFASDVWNGIETVSPRTSYEALVAHQLTAFVHEHEAKFTENLAGIRWLHGLAESSDAEAWNTQIFTDWLLRPVVEEEDFLLHTDALECLNMKQTEFPGFVGPETGKVVEIDAAVAGFDEACVFCYNRFQSLGQEGEPVHVLQCCGARVGSVCFEAYDSTDCRFCRVCMESG